MWIQGKWAQETGSIVRPCSLWDADKQEVDSFTPPERIVVSLTTALVKARIMVKYGGFPWMLANMVRFLDTAAHGDRSISSKWDILAV